MDLGTPGQLLILPITKSWPLS